MKKYILIFMFFAIVVNWDILSGYIGLSSNQYTIGHYTDDKWYKGHSGYSEAMKVSDKNETPALIYMRTDWCKYCKKFESEILTNYEVNDHLKKFVKVKINPDKSKQNKKLYEKLSGKGFPTLMFQYGEEGKLARVRAPYTRNASGWKLMTTNEFIAMLNKYGS